MLQGCLVGTVKGLQANYVAQFEEQERQLAIAYGMAKSALDQVRDLEAKVRGYGCIF